MYIYSVWHQRLYRNDVLLQLITNMAEQFTKKEIIKLFQ